MPSGLAKQRQKVTDRSGRDKQVPGQRGDTQAYTEAYTEAWNPAQKKDNQGAVPDSTQNRCQPGIRCTWD